MPSSHLILCRPLLLLPPIPPSIRVFSSESALPIRGPKYWSFIFSISPSNEYPGLISFRMDWLDLLLSKGGLGLPSGANGKESACQCRRLGFDHWVSTMPWRRKWQLAPILLPAKPHGQRSLAGYSPWGHKEMNVTECMRAHLPTHTHTPPPQHTRGILVL